MTQKNQIWDHVLKINQTVCFFAGRTEDPPASLPLSWNRHLHILCDLSGTGKLPLPIQHPPPHPTSKHTSSWGRYLSVCISPMPSSVSGVKEWMLEDKLHAFRDPASSAPYPDTAIPFTAAADGPPPNSYLQFAQPHSDCLSKVKTPVLENWGHKGFPFRWVIGRNVQLEWEKEKALVFWEDLGVKGRW